MNSLLILAGVWFLFLALNYVPDLVRWVVRGVRAWRRR